MPLLEPGTPRPPREPSHADLQVVQRTIADLHRVLADPVMEQGRALAQQMAKETASALKGAGLTQESLAAFAADRQALVEQGKRLAADVRRIEEMARPAEMPTHFVMPPRPASQEDMRRIEAKLDAAEAENAELRRRIAQIDLRTERMAKHFDPPADLDQPGQAADEAE